MKNKKIIGRIKECERLDECMNSDNAQLIIVYGRRRVGKTFLINEYFNNKFAFKLTGAYGQTKKLQIRNFTSELNRKSKKEWKVAKDWIEAFDNLREYLESLPQDEKQVVFIDEMPWLDVHKSGFLSAFEWFWNDFASTKSNLVFIVCGSATSWMDEKIANNKGGLFNRQTAKLYLEPFKLYEVEAYLESKGINWSRYDCAECYMIMGGIPYYLSLLSNKLTYRQNIDRLFFKKNSELSNEFEHLYRTLFTNSDNYIKVVEALSSKKTGLTRAQILEKTKLSANGSFSKILKNLELSGFVRVSNFHTRKKKDVLYHLSDYYTLFYFKYIKGNYGKDEHYWSNSIDNPSRRAWSGLTFEQLCRDHIPQIKQRLGISGVLSEEYSWSSKGDDTNKGAQINLIIDRRDRVLNLCEMKFSISEYEITKSYDENLRNKIDVFRRETNCKYSIQTTMITSYGVKKNKYSSMIQSQVTLDDLFEQER